MTSLFLIALLAATMVSAQEDKPIPASELRNEILKQDSLLFEAFNKRDVETFQDFLSKELEFFHDKGGLTGFDHSVSYLKGLAEKDNGVKRELKIASLEVFPIPGYGAMQIGSHTFCHPGNGKSECGTFKFVHIWKQQEGKWKLTRVISYDH